VSNPEPAVVETVVKRGRRRQALRLIVMSALIFAAGIATGISAERYHHPPRHEGTPMAADPPVEIQVRHLRDELLLSDDQTKQITTIYKTRFDALKKIRDQIAPQFKTEYEGLRDDVKKVLNTTQFDKWSQRFDVVRNRMLPPSQHGPGPMGGPDRGPDGQRPPRGPGERGGPLGPGPEGERGPPPGPFEGPPPGPGQGPPEPLPPPR
jgi:hypothetical protein